VFKHNAALAVALCAAAALCPTSGRADDLLTWDDCVREAAARNADVRVARANLDASGYQTRAAYSGFYPQLSAGVSYNDVSGSSASPTTSSTSAYSTSVSITQNLFAGFQDQARVDQASANEETNEAVFVAAKAKLSQDLKTAFAGLLYAQNNIVLTENIVRRLEENLRLVELRFEGGRENKGSYLLTRASLSQARYENLQARQALRSAQAQLARVLGREQPGDLRVADGVPLSAPGAAPDFARLIEATPEYRQAQAQQRAAAAGVQLARAPLFPSVNLTGSVARDGESWFPDDNRRVVGVNVSIPLFSGGRDYYGMKSAASSLEAAVSNKESVDRQILVRLNQTYAAFVESVEKLNVDSDFLQAATTRAEIARARYNNGLLSFDEWDRIENDLIQRQKAFLQSQRDRVTAEAGWEQARGAGVIP